MKKTVLFLILALFFNKINAQEKAMAISIGSGYAGSGLAFNIGLDLIKSNENFIAVNLFYNAYDIKKEIYTIPYSLMLLDPSYNINLLKNPKSNFSISLGLGASLGLESLNAGKKDLETGAELEYTGGFIYGASSNLNFRYALTDKLDVQLKNNLNYHLNSDIGNMLNLTTIGIRIIF